MCGKKALAVARARTDVLARAALIFRIRARLEQTIAASATPARLSQIKLTHLRLAVELAWTIFVFLTPPLLPWIKRAYWLIEFVVLNRKSPFESYTFNSVNFWFVSFILQ